MRSHSSIAEAHVQTRQARRHLAELCRALEQRAQTKRQGDVRIECTDADGTIDFGWARCSIHADETTLTLKAEADEEDALAQLCELITRHLEGHKEDELTVTWLRDGAPIVRSDTDRRNRMRAFHRRMRHQ